MTYRKRYNYPVGNEIPETVQISLYLGLTRITAVFFIVVVNVFKNITVKLLFCPDQRLDASLKGKGEERILLCHVVVEVLDTVGL